MYGKIACIGRTSSVSYRNTWSDLCYRETFHARVISTTFYPNDSSAVVVLYVFSIVNESGNSNEEVIPAKQVRQALTSGDGLRASGFTVQNTSSPSAPPATPFPTSDGLSHALLSGIIVGGVLGVVLLLSLLIAIVVHRR